MTDELHRLAQLEGQIEDVARQTNICRYVNDSGDRYGAAERAEAMTLALDQLYDMVETLQKAFTRLCEVTA